ncbi:cation:proton antiporter [Oleiharenicola lentus]|uniref:cation:proton antiporter n=1 Tax=Oleiharenicola lentus TaxID=2508720 RepID=UPI003F6820DB
MHNLDLILTLTGGLVAALALGLITNRLGLSPIVGYLLAGIVVGPYTPGFVANKEIADQFAEMGVILLMFGVGLQFHFKELLAVKHIAIPGAVFQSLTATALGALAMHFLGWTWTAGIIFGLAISVASTVVLIRVLVDNNDLHTPTGHIAVGWLVMEDLFTVFALVMLPAIFGAESGEFNLLTAIGLPTLKIGALVAFVFIVGGWGVPRLLGYIAKTGSRELFTLAVLMMALGIAVGSAQFFGVSMALGAFLAGMVVARSEFSMRAATEALPMRDAFAVLFFVSVGMLVDFKSLLESPAAVIAALAVILIGKPLAAWLLVVVMRYPLKVALSVAVALAQIGEFSFILATVGRQLNILPDAASNALVAAAIVSITINPMLYRAIDPIESWMQRQGWIPKFLKGGAGTTTKTANAPGPKTSRRAIVVGYGPVGQTVSRLLRDNEIEPTVIELSHDTFEKLRQKGTHVIYGDASHPDTLKGAGIMEADFLILSASSIQASRELIKEAVKLNPRLRVLARTAYLRELPSLLEAGAHEVFTGEGEVALSMTEHILRSFGATPEQIDRESERIREEVLDVNIQKSAAAKA